MSRSITTENRAAVLAAHSEAVVLVAFEFDTPVYVHSRIGDIDYDGDTYIGVGDFGGVEPPEEQLTVAPGPFRLVLSGVEDTYIAEALDAGNFGDLVTVYMGFIGPDGALVSDPEILGRGDFEFAGVELDAGESKIVVTVQHELAGLAEADGDRWTDEDQQSKFPGDTGLSYVTDVPGKILKWAGGPVESFPTGGRRFPTGPKTG